MSQLQVGDARRTASATELGSGAASNEEYLWYVGRALHEMLSIAAELGDGRVCIRPTLPGANTAYGLITHCLGVADYWLGALIAGRVVERDRAAEFAATGTVASLIHAVTAAITQMGTDLRSLESATPPRTEPDPSFLGPRRPLSQAGVLLHVLEELAQHHGQLEVLRDVLLLQQDVVQPPDPQRQFEPPLGWLRGKRGVKWHRPGADVVPAWVADMDFPVAEPIREAITATLDRGDLGYPDWPVNPLAEPFAARMATRHGWNADPGHVRTLTDVIQGLQIVTELATEPGDGIVVALPNYPPFLASVPGQQRRLLPLYVEQVDDSWRWDLARLDRDLDQHNAKVVLLVNPHNPTGRVLTRAELTDLAQLVLRRNLLVISDEIHADLTPRHHHIPFASLHPDVARRTVTLTSATKAFNIAGLRCAVAHIGPDDLRRRWDAQAPDARGAINVLGVEATRAAWLDGDTWLDGVRAHLTAQRSRLNTRLQPLPVHFIPPEATYLAWLDWTDARLNADVTAFFREHAGVELAAGPNYGGTPNHTRLNFATSTAVLDEVLNRISALV